MLSSIVLLSAFLGQVICEPVLVPSNPVVVGPPIYIDYRLGGMTERTRQYLVVPYRDGKGRRVPVINGYVPGITHTRYANGAEKIVYDYTIWETYDAVMAKWKESQEKARLGTEKPKVITEPLIPVPDTQSVLAKPKPNPPKPNPPKPNPKEELKLNPPIKPVPSYLEPVPPLTEEPRVIIPPNYKDEK